MKNSRYLVLVSLVALLSGCGGSSSPKVAADVQKPTGFAPQNYDNLEISGQFSCNYRQDPDLSRSISRNGIVINPFLSYQLVSSGAPARNLETHELLKDRMQQQLLSLTKPFLENARIQEALAKKALDQERDAFEKAGSPAAASENQANQQRLNDLEGRRDKIKNEIDTFETRLEKDKGFADGYNRFRTYYPESDIYKIDYAYVNTPAVKELKRIGKELGDEKIESVSDLDALYESAVLKTIKQLRGAIQQRDEIRANSPARQMELRRTWDATIVELKKFDARDVKNQSNIEAMLKNIENSETQAKAKFILSILRTDANGLNGLVTLTYGVGSCAVTIKTKSWSLTPLSQTMSDGSTYSKLVIKNATRSEHLSTDCPGWSEDLYSKSNEQTSKISEAAISMLIKSNGDVRLDDGTDSFDQGTLQRTLCDSVQGYETKDINFTGLKVSYAK